MHGLKTPVKRKKLPERIKNARPNVCSLPESYFKDTNRVKDGKDIPFNTSQKKVRMFVLISDNRFQSRLLPGIKTVISNDEGVSSSRGHKSPKRVWPVDLQQGHGVKTEENGEPMQQMVLEQLGAVWKMNE